MYDFYDLKPRDAPGRPLPADAINYDGQWLDYFVQGFRTLTVSGIEGFSRQINAPESSGDGAIYLSSRLESRKIEVEFELKTTTITEFNSAMENLKIILSRPNARIVFNSDSDFHYTGSVVSLELEKPLLATKGRIEIECPDPYKYSDVKTFNIVEGRYPNFTDNSILYPQSPKTIEFVANSDLQNVEITSGRYKLILNEAVSKGAKVVFDFDNLDVKVNGVSRLMSLDLSSDFSDFKINAYLNISFPDAINKKVTYEVKRL